MLVISKGSRRLRRFDTQRKRKLVRSEGDEREGQRRDARRGRNKTFRSSKPMHEDTQRAKNEETEGWGADPSQVNTSDQ